VCVTPPIALVSVSHSFILERLAIAALRQRREKAFETVVEQAVEVARQFSGIAAQRDQRHGDS